MKAPYSLLALGVHPAAACAASVLLSSVWLLACGGGDMGAERAEAQTGAGPPADAHGSAALEPGAPPPSSEDALPAPPATTGRLVVDPDEVARCRLPTPVHHPEWVRARGRVFTRADGQDLALDVFRAPGSEPKPAIVLLHGGGWRAGERGHVNEPARAFASLGYAAVPVSYRLVAGEQGRHPAAVNDVRCAVRHLRVHAEELGIDPARIGVLGFSAGGHLAAMVGTASEATGLEPECPLTDGSPSVQAAVAFYGAHDLNARFGSGARALIREFVGPPNSAEQRAAASPITYVDAHDPPMLLVHGRRDTVVPIEQSRLMFARLREAGVPAQLVEIREGLHGFSIFREGRHPRASCTTLRFLARHLRPTDVPPRRPSVRRASPRAAPVEPP